MTKRYDVVSGYKYKTQSGEEKTQWIRVGSMFENEKGFSIRLRAIPTATDEKGEISLAAFPPRDRDDRDRGGSRRGNDDGDMW